MNFDVSVIIPGWNVENQIVKAIDSVLKQNFNGNIEIIAVLSESSDKTKEIVEEMQRSHRNIVILDSPKKNPAFNRVLGVKHANGEYICFLDADDYYHPDFIQTMVDEIKKGYDIVNCSFFVDTNGKIKKNAFTKNAEFNSVKACDELLKDSSMRSFLWNKIYKKTLFESEQVPFIKSHSVCFEDLIINFAIFMKAKKIKSIKKPLYYYVNNSNSLAKRENPNRFMEHLSAFMTVRYLCDLNENTDYTKSFRRRMFRTKLSLWFDGYSSRHVNGHGGLKELSLNKTLIKVLKQKEKNNLDTLPIKEFLIECLTPIDL